MASVPSGLSDGSADPGDSISNDINPADVAQGAQLALANGHSWGDISLHVGDQETGRPSIGDVWFSGNTYTSDPSNMPALSSSQINEGAGPVGEALMGAAAGAGVAAVRGAIAGAAALAPDAVDTALQSTRAAAMGVQTTTAGLTAKSGADLAVEDVGDVLNQTLGNKWVRRAAGAAAAYNTFYPLKSKAK
jgi:hypothetical protein